jgi:hypothetical protein
MSTTPPKATLLQRLSDRHRYPRHPRAGDQVVFLACAVILRVLILAKEFPGKNFKGGLEPPPTNSSLLN